MRTEKEIRKLIELIDAKYDSAKTILEWVLEGLEKENLGELLVEDLKEEVN